MPLFEHQTKALDRVAVVGFEGLYEIDTYGNVFSILQTRSGRIRKLADYPNEAGYSPLCKI